MCFYVYIFVYTSTHYYAHSVVFVLVNSREGDTTHLSTCLFSSDNLCMCYK